MKAFFSDLMTRYKTQSILIWAGFVVAIFTPAWSFQMGRFVWELPALVMIPLALFTIIAWFAWIKRMRISKPTTYYIGGPNPSDDNDGLTPETGFQTVKHAFKVADPGDVIKSVANNYINTVRR